MLVTVGCFRRYASWGSTSHVSAVRCISRPTSSLILPADQQGQRINQSPAGARVGPTRLCGSFPRGHGQIPAHFGSSTRIGTRCGHDAYGPNATLKEQAKRDQAKGPWERGNQEAGARRRQGAGAPTPGGRSPTSARTATLSVELQPAVRRRPPLRGPPGG